MKNLVPALLWLIYFGCSNPSETRQGVSVPYDAAARTCSGCWEACKGGRGLTEAEVVHCAEECTELCTRDQ